MKAIIEELEGILINSSVHHPQSQGQTERVNYTLKMILKAILRRKNKTTWNATDLAEAVLIYNLRVHKTTGFAPLVLEGYYPLAFGSLVYHDPARTLDDDRLTPIEQGKYDRITQKAIENLKKAAAKRESKRTGELPFQIEIGDRIAVRNGNDKKMTRNNQDAFPYEGFVVKVSKDGFSAKVEWITPPGSAEVGSTSANFYAYENIRLLEKNAKTYELNFLFGKFKTFFFF